MLAIATHATVTPLPGSSPQSADLRQDFPNEVVVRVTDAKGKPVVSAQVFWSIPYTGFNGYAVTQLDTSHCFPDLGLNCSALTDGDGLVRLGRFRASLAASVTRISLSATYKSANLGGTELIFRSASTYAPMEITLVAGARQDAVVGQYLPSQVVARVMNGDGSPAAGRSVSFFPASNGVDAGFVTENFPFGSTAAITDAEGYARAPAFYTGRGVGEYSLSASTDDPGTIRSTTRAFGGGIIRTADGREALNLQNMWWSGLAENGWGFSMTQHADAMFNVLFIYDAAGNPTWYVQPSPGWSAGVGSKLVGTMYKTRGSPYWAYDTSRFMVIQTPTLLGTVDFGGENSATFNVDFGPPPTQTSKAIRIQDFTGDTPSPITGVGDMWWGGLAQNGWGIAIHEQFGNLFSVWFTYDGEGAPTWFVMPGGTWTDSRTYSGTIYRTRGSPWLGVPYEASKLAVNIAGTYRLRFNGDKPTSATLEYSLEGHSGSLALTRQPFGSDN